MTAVVPIKWVLLEGEERERKGGREGGKEEGRDGEKRKGVEGRGRERKEKKATHQSINPKGI